MSIESQDWRKYERKIHEELSNVYTDCDFEFDDKIVNQLLSTLKDLDGWQNENDKGQVVRDENGKPIPLQSAYAIPGIIDINLINYTITFTIFDRFAKIL